MYDRDLVIEILAQILTASSRIERRFVDKLFSQPNLLKIIVKRLCANILLAMQNTNNNHLFFDNSKIETTTFIRKSSQTNTDPIS